MKIVFFCPSLELGRDGVGDYTRRLASECVARGHACTVIALHDPHIGAETETTESGVRLVRVPTMQPWAARVDRVAAIVREVNPDWISWQFVAYGFHPKGLVAPALRQLAGKLRDRRAHVMLHELWIGLETSSVWWPRVVGWGQRRGLVNFLRELQPVRLHTSNPTYQAELARLGFAAEVLGLFGNVPVAPSSAEALARFVPAAAGEARAAWLVAVTFGTLHPQWQPDATVEWFLATARRLGRKPALVAAGRAGAHHGAILEHFSQRGVPVSVTGEQEAETVSRLLRAADFGIAPHPWALIGKSGAAAAMLEHGLPVLVPRDDWQLRKGSAQPVATSDPLLVRLAGLDAERTDRWLASRRSAQAALPQITAEFLNALNLP